MPAEPLPEELNPRDPRLAALLPLASGRLSERDADELRLLKAIIQRQLGLRCDAYKEPCLRRRLAVRMRARAVHSYAEYGQLLSREPEEAEQLLDAITINVSKFFRNREVWDTLRRKVVPELFRMSPRQVRLWSAGCAGGEEPYTLAMVLWQYAEEHNLLQQLRRFDILATDIDPTVLEQARNGGYNDFAFGEITEADRRRFFEGSRPREEIRRMVRFEQLDLMSDPLPRGLHLLVCRNVIIYFERSIQERLFQQFHESLLPGGFLLMGKVESLFGQSGKLFQPLASRERIFCKT
jgi:chemotaxis methyl-accepting protein methylase